MSYIPRMRESSAGWLGQGQIVYSTSGHANNPFADSPALQQLQQQNKQVQAQRRAAQQNKSILDRFGGKTVKVGDKYVEQSQLETARQYIKNETARKIGQVQKDYVENALSKKTSLNPYVIDRNLGLDRTPKSAQESMGVFVKDDVRRTLSQGTSLSPEVIDHNLGLDRAAKSAQESAEAFKPENIVKQQTIQPRYGLQEFIDRSQGIGSPAKSAQESAGAYIKYDIEQALSKKNPFSPEVIDHNLGLDKAAKSAQESASAFVEHGLTDTEKALEGTTKESKGFMGTLKGLFGKAKNAVKKGWSKFTAFAKTPKGKYTLIAAAVVAVIAGVCAYVADRFSDKNKPTPTNGPDKIFMPKLEEKPAAVEDDEDVDDTDDSEKTDKADKANEAKAAAEAEKKEADKAAEANKDKREPEKVSGDEYEVVEGDCVWNIAKAHLKELNSDIDDYTPTNVDILRHTKKLMEINDLHYESDNYVVIIQPGQKIKLKKSE